MHELPLKHAVSEKDVSPWPVPFTAIIQYEKNLQNAYFRLYF